MMNIENSDHFYFRSPQKGSMAEPENIPGGRVSQGTYSAFVPAPLPPEFIRSLMEMAEWGGF
jgi:hypothetical protein